MWLGTSFPMPAVCPNSVLTPLLLFRGGFSANGFSEFAPCVCLAVGWAKVVTWAEAGAEVGVDAEVVAGVEVDAGVVAGVEVDVEVVAGVEAEVGVDAKVLFF